MKPEQNEPLSSAAVGGMLDLKQSQLEFKKLVRLFYSRRGKNHLCETFMTDDKSGCFFFCFPVQNFSLDILLFATAPHNADQNEGKAQLIFHLL